MNAPGVAEVIREALDSRGQVSNIKATGDRAAHLELATMVEGMPRVFEIKVEELERG